MDKLWYNYSVSKRVKPGYVELRFQVLKETKEAIEEYAKLDGRKVAQFCRWLIENFVREMEEENDNRSEHGDSRNILEGLGDGRKTLQGKNSKTSK